MIGIMILVFGLAALAVTLYGLVTAGSKADNAEDELYNRILPRRRQ